MVRIRPVMRAKHAPSPGPDPHRGRSHAKGWGRATPRDKRRAATEIYAETPVIVPIAVVAFNVPHKVAPAPAGYHTHRGRSLATPAWQATPPREIYAEAAVIVPMAISMPPVIKNSPLAWG